MTVLVTGVAGFIGYHVARALLGRGEAVIGIDNLNDYYEVSLKRARLAGLEGRPGFSFRPVDNAGKPIANALAPGKRPRSSMAPTIVFDEANPSAKWTVEVRMTINGKTVERSLPATWSEGSDRLTAEIVGEFLFSEFGIEPYSTMLGAIRNDDRFHLFVQIQARAVR